MKKLKYISALVFIFSAGTFACNSEYIKPLGGGGDQDEDPIVIPPPPPEQNTTPVDSLNI
jgi:hypothetical protein